MHGRRVGVLGEQGELLLCREAAAHRHVLELAEIEHELARHVPRACQLGARARAEREA